MSNLKPDSDHAIKFDIKKDQAEILRTIKTIFNRHNLGLTDVQSNEASVYYYLLINNFPINIQEITKKSLLPFNIRSVKTLKKGRDILLKTGFIAQILTQDMNDNNMNRFDNDYLPANPIIIWNEIENLLDAKTRNFRKDHAKVLEDQFINTFKNHGFLGNFGDNGCITILYSSRWFTYTILNNLNIPENKNMDMMLSGLRSFDTERIDSYRKMLSNKKFAIRALFDPTNYIINTEELDELKNSTAKSTKDFGDKLNSVNEFEEGKLKREKEFEELIKITKEFEDGLKREKESEFKIKITEELKNMIKITKEFEDGLKREKESEFKIKITEELENMIKITKRFEDRLESAKKFEDRLESAKNLTNEKEFRGKKFLGKIEIRYPKANYSTSRRVIFDKMAIDAKKLLPFTRAEPSYVGMIYLNDENINFLRHNFNALWEGSTTITSLSSL
jgi:hypothetical protein